MNVRGNSVMAGRILALLTLPLLASCSNETGPSGNGGGQQTPTMVDISVESRYIRIHGSCDKNIFNNQVLAEFHYQVIIDGPGRREVHGTSNYGAVTAIPSQRRPGTSIDFANHTLTFRNVELGTVVTVTLRLTEWDGVLPDPRMDDESRGKSPNTFRTGTHTESINVGSGDCHGELFFDVTVTER